MGQQFSDPVIDFVDPIHFTQNDLQIGAVGMQGSRRTMEDYHLALPSLPSRPDHILLGVFDGHGGNAMAEYVQQNLVRVLEETLLVQPDLGEAIKTAFFQLDANVLEQGPVRNEDGTTPGTTAIVAIVTPTDGTIVCANVGDSRSCILTQDGRVVPLSIDHKPNLDAERKRIEAAGGVVLKNRVDGNLALSRALGDYEYKTNAALSVTQQKVTAEADIITVRRDDDDDAAAFLLLASDGLWDVMTNEEAMEEVRKLMVDEGETNVLLVAEELVHLCVCERRSMDNVTAVVVRFPYAEISKGEGEGVLGRRQRRQEALAAAQAATKALAAGSP
jgi:serine/threonine protein phosphatase PrpC